MLKRKIFHLNLNFRHWKLIYKTLHINSIRRTLIVNSLYVRIVKLVKNGNIHILFLKKKVNNFLTLINWLDMIVLMTSF